MKKRYAFMFLLGLLMGSFLTSAVVFFDTYYIYRADEGWKIENKAYWEGNFQGWRNGYRAGGGKYGTAVTWDELEKK